jgi:hypothetical protein
VKSYLMSPALEIIFCCAFMFTPAPSPQMPAQPGSLQISSTTKGLKIIINERPRPEVTPVTLVVSPGTYTVKVGDCDQQTVQVFSGETKQVNCPK